MPNWVQNEIILIGSENQIKNMFNDALENSGVSREENLQNAYKALCEYGTHKESRNTDDCDVFSRTKKIVITQKGITMGTFRPIPDTFLEYDTENYPKDFKDAAAEQKEKYGIVGWYQYNLSTFGCKWDADIDISDVSGSGDNVFVRMWIETPWSTPMAFLEWLKETYELDVWVASADEGNCFLFWENLGGDSLDYAKDYDALSEEEMMDCSTFDYGKNIVGYDMRNAIRKDYPSLFS